MKNLKVEVSKRSCVFHLHISFPLVTLQSLLRFFREKEVVVNGMVLLNENPKATILLLDLAIDKNRMEEIITAIKMKPGVLSLEDEKTGEKNMVRVLAPFLRKEKF